MKNVKKDLSVIGIEKMSAQETWFNELLKENPKFIKGKYEPIDFMMAQSYRVAIGAIFENGALVSNFDVGTTDYTLEDLGKLKFISRNKSIVTGFSGMQGVMAMSESKKEQGVADLFKKFKEYGNQA